MTGVQTCALPIFKKGKTRITDLRAILPAAQLPCSIGIAYCAAERSLPEPREIGRVELQGSNSQSVRCSPRKFHPRAFCSGNRFSGRTQLIQSFKQSQWDRGNFRFFLTCYRKTKHVIERELDCPTSIFMSERASSTWFNNPASAGDAGRSFLRSRFSGRLHDSDVPFFDWQKRTV